MPNIGATAEYDMQRVAALHRYGILDTEPERAYDDIAALACHVCDVPYATISLVGRERQWFKSEIGLGVKGSSRADSLCTYTVANREPLIIEDTLLDERSRDNLFVRGGPRIRFYAGVPLVTYDDYALGTVCVFDTRPRSLKATQVAALQALARQVMSHLELRRLMLERDRDAEALRTAEKLAAVGRLASSMAHEINNPLQSVTNLLFLAETNVGEDSFARDVLRDAREELGRVTQVVTQTLRFHRQSECARPVRLADLMKSTVTLFHTRLRDTQTRVEVRDRQMQPLSCYAADVRQVMANLLANALEAIAIGHGQRVCVHIAEATHPQTGVHGVRFTLSDDGEGMDSVTQKHLFEPFFSTRGARSAGLGLWVSRGILETHRATVSLRSRTEGRQRGTVFSVFFPRGDGGA